VIYESGQPNAAVLLLETGCIESYLIVQDPNRPGVHKENYLDDLDPGKVFGISAMYEFSGKSGGHTIQPGLPDERQSRGRTV
jgi:hypothetical protein